MTTEQTIDHNCEIYLNGENSHLVVSWSRKYGDVYCSAVAFDGSVDVTKKAMEQESYEVVGVIDLNEEVEPQRDTIVEKIQLL